MELDVIFAIILGILSFACGFTTMLIFYKKRKEKSVNDISARLPSLITIEIILLLWYLMICTPLTLYLYFYFSENNVVASTIFILSFIPIHTTHIIRIWLLKLKYVITSLSMLNQLGIVKWKDIRNQIWTKIYYKHKWLHSISILLIISITLDIILTIIYLSLSLINIQYGLYFNIIVFSLLTLCLIIGAFSIKSFNDPFNIFREENIVLFIWFIVLIIFGIFAIFLWHNLLTHKSWTITVTFLSDIVAVCSILIHFHFNHKSIEAAQKNLPSLGIIVSTKEGLEKFLRFLVAELSVENLEFFTLSMRWRHRLVLRDKRRARKRTSKLSKSPDPLVPTQIQANIHDQNGILQTATGTTANVPDSPESPNTATFTYTSPKQTTPVGELLKKMKRSSRLADISEMISTLTGATTTNSKSAKKRTTHTSQTLLAFQKQNPGNEALTHLEQLPFPILTFEFLDRDVIKNGQQSPHKSNKSNNSNLKQPQENLENTMTETYVLEFSKTKTLTAQPPIIQKGTATETVVSLFFEQYDVMQINKRRMTEMSKTNTANTHTRNTITNTNQSNISKTPNTKIGANISKTENNLTLQTQLGYATTESNVKSATITGTPGTGTRTITISVTKKKPIHLNVTPAQGPVQHDEDSFTLKEIDLQQTPVPDTPIPATKRSSSTVTKSQNKSAQITPFFSGNGSIQNNLHNYDDFMLNNMEQVKEELELNANQNVNMPNLLQQKSITVTIDKVDEDKKSSRTSRSARTATPSTFVSERKSKSGSIIEEENQEKKSKHVLQDSDHKQIQNTLSSVQVVDDTNNMLINRLSVWKTDDTMNFNEEKKSNININSNGVGGGGGKERNAVTFSGWFEGDAAFEMYDEEWTEEFMSSKTVSYDRFIILSEEINVCFVARNSLRSFFGEYDTVKKFKDVEIAKYDTMLEIAWRDVWQNLNDSMRRFHQSTFYHEWLESNAANGLNVIPMNVGK